MCVIELLKLMSIERDVGYFFQAYFYNAYLAKGEIALRAVTNF